VRNKTRQRRRSLRPDYLRRRGPQALPATFGVSARLRGRSTAPDVLITTAGIIAVPYGKKAQTVRTASKARSAPPPLPFALNQPAAAARHRTSYSRCRRWRSCSATPPQDRNGSPVHFAWLAYCQSKLATCLFTSELQRAPGTPPVPPQGPLRPTPATPRPPAGPQRPAVVGRRLFPICTRPGHRR